MSQINANAILDANGGTTASINGYTPTASNMAGKNRIINGAMMIDQRNAGASITPTNGQYSVDRFMCIQSTSSKYSAQQNAGSVTPPTGFTNYLGATSLSAYSVASGDQFYFNQRIEANNLSDLGWGTASAKTVTISFWVRSSLTGTFGGSVVNAPTFNYSYPFTYTISAANTWEQKSVTIAGPTAGTWASSGTGAGMQLAFGLGVGSTFSGTAGSWSGSLFYSATGATSVVGTSGATFYITGVQLEVGSAATEFEHRLYPQELALCQRYYVELFGWDKGSTVGRATYRPAGRWSTNQVGFSLSTPVPLRATPTVTLSGSYALEQGGSSGSVTSLSSVGGFDADAVYLILNTSINPAAGHAGAVLAGGSSGTTNMTVSAEL